MAYPRANNADDLDSSVLAFDSSMTQTVPGTSYQEMFVRSLMRGPSVLLLGQRYLAGGQPGPDPLLSEISRKFGSEARTYDALFALPAGADNTAARHWIAARAALLNVPAPLASAARFAWSAVYSSAIDSRWEEAFRNTWRDTEPVLSPDFKPADPRNRTLLHCTYLFGSVARVEPDETAPSNALQFARRSSSTVALLSRLPELLTPLGVLAIESWDPEFDWLS